MPVPRFFLLLPTLLLTAAASAAPVPLFDGKTLAGWEGGATWRVEEGTITGGSAAGNPQNEFLATAQSYRNFRLTLEYKLTGTEGFVNGGVQFRSQRIAEPPNGMNGVALGLVIRECSIARGKPLLLSRFHGTLT